MRAGDTKADGGDEMVEIARTANISCLSANSFSGHGSHGPKAAAEAMVGFLIVLGAAAWAQGAAGFVPPAGPFCAGALPSRASAQGPIARNARAPAVARTSLPLATRPARRQAKILKSTRYSDCMW
jgi:hypothetical protein